MRVGCLVSTLVPIVAVLGCEAPALHPSGTRLEAGADFSGLFFWHPETLAYTRPAASAPADLNDLWVRELAEPSPRAALTGVDWIPPTWEPNARVGDLIITQSAVTRVYDVSQHAALTLSLSPPAASAGAVSPDISNLAVALSPQGKNLAAYPRSSALGDDIFAFGPLGAMVTSAGLHVESADFAGDDLVVIGHRTGDPDGLRVLARVSAVDHSVSVRLNVLEPWIAPPDSPFPAGEDPYRVGCGSFSPPACNWFQVIGCSDDTPVCATGERPCAVIFARQGPEHGLQLQPTVYDFNTQVATPIDSKLPAVAGARTVPPGFVRAPDGRSVVWFDTSLAPSAGLASWDGCAHRYTRCGFPAGVISPSPWGWSPDSMTFIATGYPNVDRSPILRLSVSPPDCSFFSDGAETLIARVPPFDFAFSHDGKKVAFFEISDDPITGARPRLWLAQGTTAVPIATGDFNDAVFSPDGQRLAILRVNDQRKNLGVVDLTAPELSEQPLVASLGAMMLADRRLLALTDWNPQEETGRLTLFDLVTGQSTELGTAIPDFAVADSVDGPATLAYTVHTRFPSAADGLWLWQLPEGAKP